MYMGPVLDSGHGGGDLGTGADANSDGDCSQGGSGPSSGRAEDGRVLGLALTQALPAPMAARGGVRGGPESSGRGRSGSGGGWAREWRPGPRSRPPRAASSARAARRRRRTQVTVSAPIRPAMSTQAAMTRSSRTERRAPPGSPGLAAAAGCVGAAAMAGWVAGAGVGVVGVGRG